VRRISGDHRGVRDIRRQQARCVPRFRQVRSGEKSLAERPGGPSRHLGRNGLPAATPEPAGHRLLLPARLDYQLDHKSSPTQRAVTPDAGLYAPGWTVSILSNLS
jgi:hypothetical protein